MGLPMVTLSGETFASRVAGSLLRTLDLSELMTHSHDEYEAMASRLAQSPDELSQIRRKLAKNVSNPHSTMDMPSPGMSSKPTKKCGNYSKQVNRHNRLQSDKTVGSARPATLCERTRSKFFCDVGYVISLPSFLRHDYSTVIYPLMFQREFNPKWIVMVIQTL